jgi:hypothetical protein
LKMILGSANDFINDHLFLLYISGTKFYLITITLSIAAIQLLSVIRSQG